MGFWQNPLIEFSDQHAIWPVDILEVLLIWLSARFLIWFLYRVVFKRIFQSVELEANRQKAIKKSVQYFIYVIAAIFSFKALGFSLSFWKYSLVEFSEHTIRPVDLVEVVLVWLIAYSIIWLLTRIILNRLFKRNHIDHGREFAVTQLIKYVVYTFAALATFQALGFSFSLLWAGSAALLVGVGLGLQQTFNDLFSGLVLLGEGTVEVDDILEVDGIIGRVVGIGLRTSKMVTRDRIDLIIPNSKLVTEKVVNWSHFQSSTRFLIKVGVAYDSDVEKVKELLLQAVEGQQGIMKTPPAQVQLQEFGDSSLDFVLYFFSKDFWRIEFIKSELRFRVIALFRENDIEIPFPQRDVWIKNPKGVK